MMKRVLYAGGECRTTDELAEQVVHFAAELANNGAAAEVDVPGILPDGTHGMIALVLGPASQLAVFPADEDALDTGDALERITAARAALVKPPYFPGGPLSPSIDI